MDNWMSVEDDVVTQGRGRADKAGGLPRLSVYVARRNDLSDLAMSREFILNPKGLVGWLGTRGQLVGTYFLPRSWRHAAAS